MADVEAAGAGGGRARAVHGRVDADHAAGAGRGAELDRVRDGQAAAGVVCLLETALKAKDDQQQSDPHEPPPEPKHLLARL